MDISIVIVNWNVRSLLKRCLDSIYTNCRGLSLQTIVVDNASADDSVDMVKNDFPQVSLIASQENLGYTGGNNLGAKDVKGRFLLILNPDTEIVGDALQQMITYLDAHPAVGAVGPQLLNPDGTIQPSRRGFPQLGTGFFQGTPFNKHWFKDNRYVRLYYGKDGSDDETQPVDWLVGAALMIRHKTWQEVGLFDEQFFMYSDEVDWCWRCHNAGWEIHYLPTAKIIHAEHKSANQISAKTRIIFHRSRILYFRKYFGAGWSLLLQFYLILMYFWVLLEETIRWLISGKRRHECQQNIQIYWQILKSGLQ